MTDAGVIFREENARFLVDIEKTKLTALAKLHDHCLLYLQQRYDDKFTFLDAKDKFVFYTDDLEYENGAISNEAQFNS